MQRATARSGMEQRRLISRREHCLAASRPDKGPHSITSGVSPSNADVSFKLSFKVEASASCEPLSIRVQVGRMLQSQAGFVPVSQRL